MHYNDTHYDRQAIDEERAIANQYLATANRLRKELEDARREATTYMHLLGGAQVKIDMLESTIRRILLLTDTASNYFAATFDPDGVGEIPAGWRVVEKIREELIG